MLCTYISVSAVWGQANTPAGDTTRISPDTTGLDTAAIATADRWGGTIGAQVRWRREVAFNTRDATDEGVSIGGLVIDETRTTIGRDFYSVFYSGWNAPEGAKNVTVRVREQPRPNLGTRLLVEVEGTTVFRATLQPDMQMIRRAARGALGRTMRYLKQRYEPRNTY
ncbi:CsgE family curli-type amyloid fiber assembly protein [Longibacter sp.]|uniref:CsgE family curli-type amyloid fiber assembly protein n=1 Tax=Longibacter sp. TaxID=2045415 RepID=UPI003EBA6C1F